MYNNLNITPMNLTYLSDLHNAEAELLFEQELVWF